MLDYSLGKGKFANWILSETVFSADRLGKSESVMLLGNGYMGLRSAAEEPYLHEKRGLFINGTFNQADKNEVAELPNAADVTRLDIRIDGERFSLELGETEDYRKQLNLKNAEMTRTFLWTSSKGKKLQFRFSRFVSLDNQHLIGLKMEVVNLAEAVSLSIGSGINAQMSNSGVQHFEEGVQKISEERFIQQTQTTAQSRIDVVHNAVHTLKLNNEKITGEMDKDMERRRVWMTFSILLQPNDKFELEKLATVHTSRDKEVDRAHYSLAELKTQTLEELKKVEQKGYQKLLESHQAVWQNQVWDACDIEIDSENPEDQLALRFALYHLTAMAPPLDDRLGIGAKGLSGEAYKGHSFWDTEIYLLPPFMYSNPETARSLLAYRYLGLDGARRKAAENGYAGAMYPWEAAGPADGEATPLWGGIDIVTGEQTKIWAGLIEQHISADIAFAVDQYVNVTGDAEFLEQYGFEMVFETARFWASRFEWNEERQHYEMTDVIGPDEYKEHVSNNAFTNYMAYFNLKLAMRYAEELEQKNPELWNRFMRADDHKDWQRKTDKLYLPEPRGPDGILPQDDTYLDLAEIDFGKYKKQTKVRSIYRDYNPEQINSIQVSKQADVVLLFYLMEQTFLKDDPRFSVQAKRSNFHYYEARTLHDSSLSLAMHAIAANDVGESGHAYELFRKACEIDMGPNMESSSDGIHAAAMGGIWKAAVFGFAGVRQTDGVLAINPRLPKQWRRMRFRIYWQGQLLHLDITQKLLKLALEYKKPIQFESGGRLYDLDQTMGMPLTGIGSDPN